MTKGVLPLLSIVLLVVSIGMTIAYPYYPNDDIIEEVLVPVRRIRRAAVHLPIQQRRPEKLVWIPQGPPPTSYHPRPELRPQIQQAASIKEPITAETGYGHSSHPYDYVDYGAYTGGYGAFGWYSDHPVHTYGGYH